MTEDEAREQADNDVAYVSVFIPLGDGTVERVAKEVNGRVFAFEDDDCAVISAHENARTLAASIAGVGVWSYNQQTEVFYPTHRISSIHVSNSIDDPLQEETVSR